jgi:hypothetical protein
MVLEMAVHISTQAIQLECILGWRRFLRGRVRGGCLIRFHRDWSLNWNLNWSWSSFLGFVTAILLSETPYLVEVSQNDKALIIFLSFGLIFRVK